MDEIGRTTRYLFILALFLIAVAYFAGSKQLLQTIFGGANQLDLTVTGRDAQGRFAAYPAGAAASVGNTSQGAGGWSLVKF